MSSDNSSDSSAQSTASAGSTHETSSCSSSANAGSSAPSASSNAGSASGGDHPSPSFQGSSVLTSSDSTEDVPGIQLSIEEGTERPIDRFLNEENGPFNIVGVVDGEPVVVGRSGPSMNDTINSILNPPK